MSACEYDAPNTFLVSLALDPSRLLVFEVVRQNGDADLLWLLLDRLKHGCEMSSIHTLTYLHG